MKENKCQVTVLMSVFGYQEYITETIASILNQTHKDIEFIIIDDGCDYDLKKIITGFRCNKILYVKNKVNLGLTKSLINGIKLSSSKYIARQDAGNISLPDRIEKQFNFLEENPDCYLIGSSISLIDENSERICDEIAINDFNSLRKTMPSHNCIFHSTIMFRNDGKYSYREKFKYSQDYDLYLRLVSDGMIVGNLSDIFLKERIFENSVTFNKTGQQKLYSELAKFFYSERINLDIDSYNNYDFEKIVVADEKNKDKKKVFDFFCRQKSYYLLYALESKKLRKYIRQCLSKHGFDYKLFYYYLISFFPFIIKTIRKIKNIRIQ